MMKIIALVLCVFTLWTQVVQVQSRAKERIIGGEVANAGQFPFAVAIYKNTVNGTFFCAGTLLSNRWVLTAAQCVADARIFILRLRVNSLNSNDPNAPRLSTDQYWSHPDYNPETLENDIALIALRTPVQLIFHFEPIAVLSPTTLPDGSSAVTFGWGQTSDAVAGLVDKLHYINVVSLGNEECRLFYGNQVFDTTVCVKGNYNEGICRGDIGGPLIQYGESSSVIYVVGIASFISSNGCESTDPSGFTRVAPYMAWINNITSSN